MYLVIFCHLSRDSCLCCFNLFDTCEFGREKDESISEEGPREALYVQKKYYSFVIPEMRSIPSKMLKLVVVYLNWRLNLFCFIMYVQLNSIFYVGMTKKRLSHHHTEGPRTSLPSTSSLPRVSSLGSWTRLHLQRSSSSSLAFYLELSWRHWKRRRKIRGLMSPRPAGATWQPKSGSLPTASIISSKQWRRRIRMISRQKQSSRWVPEWKKKNNKQIVNITTRMNTGYRYNRH